MRAWLRQILDAITDWVDGLSFGRKRFLLVAGLVLVALIFGILIYWVFFSSFFAPVSPGATNGANANGTTNQLPIVLVNANKPGVVNNANTGLPQVATIAQGGSTLAQVIHPGDTQNPTLNASGDVQYYDAASGKFYTVNSNGETVALNDKTFANVSQVTWSHDADKAVIQSQDGSNMVYDFKKNKQFDLSNQIMDFQFSANDTALSFKYLPQNDTQRWLGTSNIDGSNIRGVLRLGDNADNVITDWSPNNKMIGMFNQFESGTVQSVLPLGVNGENFKQFNVTGSGFNYQWLPNSQQIIYSTYSSANNYNSVLSIVDVTGGERTGTNNRSLGLVTSADKCTVSSTGTSLYCAVPVNPPQGGGIVPATLDTTPDALYKVDLTTGNKQQLALPADNTGTNLPAMKNLMLSQQEDILYYTDATTGQLRRMLLK